MYIVYILMVQDKDRQFKFVQICKWPRTQEKPTPYVNVEKSG